MSNFESRLGRNIKPYIKGQEKIDLFRVRNQLSFVPISEAEVKVLEVRDGSFDENLVPKKPNRYVHEDFPVMTEGNLSRVAVRAGDINLGYGVFGVYQEGLRKVGEVAMVRIAPAAKGLGLGSAIVNYGISRVLDKGVDVLRMEVADRTGRIDKIAGDLGFKRVSSTPGLKGNAIVERPIIEGGLDLKDRTQMAADIKIQRASENTGLWNIVDAVDRDNPLKTNPLEQVEGRVRASNYKKAGTGFDVVYWGYPGARLMVAMVRTPDNNQVIEASVKGIDPDHVRYVLRKRVNGFSVVESDFGLGEEYRGSVLRGHASDVNTALKDLVPLTELSVDLIHQVAAEKYVGG